MGSSYGHQEKKTEIRLRCDVRLQKLTNHRYEPNLAIGPFKKIPNKIPRAAFPPDPGESPRVDVGV